MFSDALRDADALPDELRFLAGGGEATRMILERDWSDHPLGQPAGWPDILKSTLSTILNSPESMILAWGRDELTFFFNQSYFPLLGPRLSRAMGAPFATVWADAWAQAKPIIDEAFAGRSQRFNDLPWKLDTDRGPADSWFTFSYSRVLDPRGEIAGLFIFTNETTERVLADAALRQSEERLRLVVEGAKDHAILTTDADGVVTTWSAGAEAVLGWTADEAIGQSASMIFTDEDRAADADLHEIAGAARDGCAPDERWHQRKDGARVFLNGSMHPLPPDAQGKARGFLKIARDETERRRSEHALRESEASAQIDAQRVQLALAAGAIIGTWVWDLRSDRFTVDEAFARAFGLDPALGREGLSLEQIVATVHPDDRDGLADAISDVIARGGAYAHQYRTLRQDGRYHWLEANGRVDHAPDGTPLSFPGVLIDVGDRRKLAEERDRALVDLRSLNETLELRVDERTRELMQVEEVLRQSQKMEAVGQLTGGVAHDFNNLLTVIRGSVDLLRRPDLPEARRQRYIDAVSDTVDRAAKLTGQLLAFARRQALLPEVFDVRTKLRGVSEMLDTVTGAMVQIAVEVPGSPCFVRADVSQFETALVNLAVNARDAMDGEGRLLLSVACGVPIPAIRGHAGSTGPFTAISVRDTGCGIPADQVERIFEPFFTTKGVGKGTGLGLSQVFGFVKQSGGDVDVRSVPGEGTVFTLFLPEEPEPARAAPALIDDPAAPAEAGLRVLVVEDNIEVGQFCTQILDDLGYQTVLACNAEEALEQIGDDGGRFDVVFSDVVMPGMGGIELATLLRERLPRLPVILASGYSHVLASDSGHGFQLLHKPYSADQLAQVLRKATARMAAGGGAGVTV
jgi:PAS domain S-box-containing protein